MFRSAFKRNRCLVPATGFYEWKRTDDTKVPHLIRTVEGSPPKGTFHKMAASIMQPSRRGTAVH